MYRKGKLTYSGKGLNNQDIIVQHEIFQEPNKCDLIEEKDTLSMRTSVA